MANIIKENIDRWYDNNLDVDNRTLYMGSINKINDGEEAGVDSSMIEYFIKGMHVMESKNDKPITIIMNNPGGDWYHGMGIYDAIKASHCVCTIIVYGYAMSMGSIILQAGDKRIMMPNSRFMIHYGYSSFDNHVKVIEKWANEEKRIAFEIEELYLKAMILKEELMGNGHLAKTLNVIINKQRELDYPIPTKLTNYSFSKKAETKKEELRTVLKEMLNFDTILNPTETIALGFADEIYRTAV